jgi:phosphoglucosamine mutase
VLTALLLAARVVSTGRSLKDLASVVTRLPQVLLGVPGVAKEKTGTDEGVAEAVAAAEARLGSTGRVLLRPSGTEPLVRVMVEAATEEQAASEAETLAEVVRARLALGG